MNTPKYEVLRISGMSGCIVSINHHSSLKSAEREADIVNAKDGPLVAKVRPARPPKA